MNVKPLTEQEREQISVEELMRLLLHYFREKQQEFERRSDHRIPEIAVLRELLLELCPIPNGIVGVSRESRNLKKKVDWVIRENSAFAMRFSEAMVLLQKRGLIAPKLRVREAYSIGVGRDMFLPLPLFLTSVGQRSIVEDDIILLVDAADDIVQSVRKEVPLDETVADFYRESIRAWQEGLLLSSCICLGAASECAIHQLAYALSDYAPEHKSSIEGKWAKKNMKDKIDTLWGWIKEVGKKDFPNEPCFKDLRSKLDALAHWYRITRNDAGHADREAILPTQEEIELPIRMFRRYTINIFQIINLLQSGPQKS